MHGQVPGSNSSLSLLVFWAAVTQTLQCVALSNRHKARGMLPGAIMLRCCIFLYQICHLLGRSDLKYVIYTAHDSGKYHMQKPERLATLLRLLHASL